jgi:uncharacterized protein involved in outer membrane biogenesis
MLAALAMLLLVLLAAFPWGSLRETVAHHLSERIGKPVTIGAMHRMDRFSLHPLVELRAVRVPQPGWVGSAGGADLATAGLLRVRFAVLPLLLGRFEIEEIEVHDAAANLVRNASGRKNWTGDRPKHNDGYDGPTIQRLSVVNTIIRYTDAKRDRRVVTVLTADDRGLRLAGTGDIRGNPVRIAATGAPIIGEGAEKPWPFHAMVEGAAVGFTLAGTMDRPLDIGHFTADATAHGDDLALVDAIIEAGLPGTQPVRLKAKVRRTSPDWEVTNLIGTIGRSDIAGYATIRKREGRTRIDGALHADRFDIDDLSSDRGKRKAAAIRAAAGPRVVPNTAIDLTRVGRTDGRLEIAARTLLWPAASPFRRLSGTVTLDHGLLTIEPLALGLERGELRGAIVVDQRRGGPELRIRLSLDSARLLDFFPDATIDGGLRGRIDLSGRGRTVREAVGRSSGVIALAARDGTIPARTASLLGQDVGRGFTTDANALATLRCMVARLEVRGGIARSAPVVIDTSRARTDVRGTIDLADETLALQLSGAPKRNSILRLSGTVPIGGRIKAPDIQLPRSAQTVGGVFKMLGNAIAGKQGAHAEDADCNALQRSALR